MSKEISPTRIFTRNQIELLLTEATGKTLEQVDKAGLFIHHQGREKVKGIAGDIIEISVLGCEKDSKQEPDILVDDIKTEIKTTGLIKPKSKESPYLYECKEPVSITAVSIPVIVNEKCFEDSNFWHKLAHMLWVYYWYKAPSTVTLEGYKNFPIIGFQFYEFNENDRLLLKQDWMLVRNFLIVIHRDFSSKKEREKQYPRLSHELRGQLMLIDTAPKFPNSPRFRLKRSFATVIADQLFSKKKFEKLRTSFSHYSEIDSRCEKLSLKFKGKTFAQIAAELQIDSNMNVKNFAEIAVIRMFGGKATKLNDIEDFAKIGIIAKSVPLLANMNGKEDMKLFLPNLVGWTDETDFEDSELHEYFANHHFLFIVYHHEEKGGSVDTIVFDGFKRVYFDEAFIEENVKPLWQDTRNLILNKELKIIRNTDKNGNWIINKSGSYQEAPNFPKKATHKVFIRGGSSLSDEKHKTLEINGMKMIPQYVWLSRDAVQELIKK